MYIHRSMSNQHINRMNGPSFCMNDDHTQYCLRVTTPLRLSPSSHDLLLRAYSFPRKDGSSGKKSTTTHAIESTAPLLGLSIEPVVVKIHPLEYIL